MTDSYETLDARQAEAVALLNQRLGEFARDFQPSNRVLVVDDERMVREVVANYLMTLDLPVEQAENAQQAIQLMAQNDYAVVFSDKNMPGMDGIRLLQVIKQKWPLTEVLIFTAYGSPKTAIEAIGFGAFDYVLKPVTDLAFIGNKVQAALARHEFESGFQSMMKFLMQALRENRTGAKDDPLERMRTILAEHKQETQGHVVLNGVPEFIGAVEGEGFRVTPVENLDGAVEAARAGPVHAVVHVERDGEPNGAEAIRRIREVRMGIGVLVLSREGDLRSIVDAIGLGVGDYLEQDMEDQSLFLTRLKRLVTRQQRVERSQYLLNTLKSLNLELMVEAPPA